VTENETKVVSMWRVGSRGEILKKILRLLAFRAALQSGGASGIYLFGDMAGGGAEPDIREAFAYFGLLADRQRVIVGSTT
jgi:hypothetical protein